MIDISKLSESDRGRKVVYQCPFSPDEGYITSWNQHFIFVRFPHFGPNGVACPPSRLSWSFPDPGPSDDEVAKAARRLERWE